MEINATNIISHCFSFFLPLGVTVFKKFNLIDRTQIIMPVFDGLRHVRVLTKPKPVRGGVSISVVYGRRVIEWHTAAERTSLSGFKKKKKCSLTKSLFHSGHETVAQKHRDFVVVVWTITHATKSVPKNNN